MKNTTYTLQGPSSNIIKGRIQITGSKSETNRLLLLKALFPAISIENTSNSDDAQAMEKGVATTQGLVDVYHAGTAMRFLTAYFATKKDADILLTGSARMQERPIRILVDALRTLGAQITYDKNEGFPPLRILGQKIKVHEVYLEAGVSSQYISALLLVGPSLENGLTLHLKGMITSVPYIKMTLSLLEQIGIKTSFKGQSIQVWPANELPAKKVVVESDWSSASYFYSIISLADIGSELELTSYHSSSLQGDAVLATIYKLLGVQTSFEGHSLTLTKVSAPSSAVLTEGLSCNLSNAPDIAQTIAVSCFGLGLACNLTGLHTLKIKETDRLLALEHELSALGASISVTEKSLHLKRFLGHINTGVTIATYHDHRMAMAFAPLALKTSLKIADAAVVNKSYPDFWEDMKALGMNVGL